MIEKTRHNLNYDVTSTSKIKFNFNKLVYSLLISWTILLVLFLGWNWTQISDGIYKEAVIALRMASDNDLSFRAWATDHGGVYVPIIPGTEPNSFLSHLDNRDITTTKGMNLTLLNPAYIMRQAYQVRLDNTGVRNRLTSLDPINPVNTPDSWEKEALLMIKNDSSIEEVHAITDFNQVPSIRLIKPFYVEEGCLKCHAHQGYQIGDLRGAISATTPLEPYNSLIHARSFSLLPGYGLIWIVGLIGIYLAVSRIQASSSALKDREARSRAMLQAIPDMFCRYSVDGRYLDIEIKENFPAYELILEKVKNNKFIGQDVASVLPIENAKKIIGAIKDAVSTGEMQIVEHNCTTQQKQFYFEERLVLVSEKEVISIIRDITEQKNSELKLEYLSYHDSLTRLHNRYYFERELKRFEISEEYPISIASIDVNGLKLINDTLGHVAGDSLLVNCAKVLRQSLRVSDVLARVGGDEFVAILPNTNEQVCQQIIQRIRDNVQEQNKKTPSLPLSLSIGIATAISDSENLMFIYKRADDAMFKEKRKSSVRENNNIIRSLLASLGKNEDNLWLPTKEAISPADISTTEKDGNP